MRPPLELAMMNRKILAALVMMLFFATTAFAQVYPQGSVDVVAAVPHGDFKDHLSTPGWGITAFGGLGIGPTPVVIGLEFGFVIYGFEKRAVPLSPTVPDVDVRVATTNGIGMAHVVLRLQSPKAEFRPFVDGLFGMKYFFTETTANYTSTTNFDDAAVSYGVGVGVDARIFKGLKGSVHLNAGVRYLLGGATDYLMKGGVQRARGAVSYDVERSETNLLLPHLGFSVRY